MKDSRITKNRLHGFTSNLKYREPGSTSKSNYAKENDNKPARLTRRECDHVILLLNRAAGSVGEALAKDIRDFMPRLQAASAAAPQGQRQGRKWYSVTWPSGAVEQHNGVASAAKRIGRSKSHIANQLSQGKGKAELPCRDENGNPAFITIERMA